MSSYRTRIGRRPKGYRKTKAKSAKSGGESISEYESSLSSCDNQSANHSSLLISPCTPPVVQLMSPEALLSAPSTPPREPSTSPQEILTSPCTPPVVQVFPPEALLSAPSTLTRDSSTPHQEIFAQEEEVTSPRASSTPPLEELTLPSVPLTPPSVISVPSPVLIPSPEQQIKDTFLKDITNTHYGSSVRTLKGAQEKCGRIFCKSESHEPHTDLCSVWSKTEDYLRFLLPHRWWAHANATGSTLHIVLMSRKTPIQLIKSLSVEKCGSVKIFIHGKEEVPVSHDFFEETSTIPELCLETVGEFCDAVLKMVKRLSEWNVCSGAENISYMPLWSTLKGCHIGVLNYDEDANRMTVRAGCCSWLVSKRHKRCPYCFKVENALYQKNSRKSSRVEPHVNTPNIHLCDAEIRSKLAEVTKQFNYHRKQVKKLRVRIRELLGSEGVEIDKDLHTELTATLRGKGSEMTELQKLFLKEQVKAGKVKKSTGMKWHPVMLRLAIYLYCSSPATYNVLLDSGMVKLPSSRTLFDYTHVTSNVEGIQKDGLAAAHNEVKNREHDYQKYYVLMFDEMTIASNLVCKKGTGEVIGFVKLNEVQEELKALEVDLNREFPTPPPMAEKVLCFMIKGCANSYKDVVAVFGTDSFNADDLFSTVWKVVGALEKVGVNVIALICDGHPANRSFFNKHVPVTKVPSKVVFDTINLCAPSRVMYFFSDLPHLLKSVRNNFTASGHPKKDRLLRKNNQFIVWRTIIELYKEERANPLRQLFKLNAQNVYLNSYSTMKVIYAAQVLSRSAANCLSSKGWPGTSETVEFMRQVNDWFDMQNGAHRSPPKTTEVVVEDDNLEELSKPLKRRKIKYS